MDYLYHYTNVETLALILSKRTIRFNAINKVDDLQEQETADIRNLGQFCFVSCWTEDDEESIPMWKMYGNLSSGVRIKMKKYPFGEKENRPMDLERALGQHVEDNSNGTYIKSVITAAEMAEKKFQSTGLVQQRDILFKVEYTQEKDKLYPKLLRQDSESRTLLLGELGKYKNKGWEFQNEWRYILLLYPFDMRNMENFQGQAMQLMDDMVNGKITMPFTYYDLDIDPNAMSGMEIMLSPKISEGNKVLVADLVEKYNPEARMVESTYTGLID